MTKDLNGWLVYLETKYKSNIDLGLDRVAKVANKLALTKFPCPVVTVAGTNGKGSCIACIQAFALAANLKVGTYSSPHLIRFNERISLNGHNIADETLCDAFAVIDDAVNYVCDRDTLPTYFEFVTLIALYIFQQQPLDLILLEVGLGGRLDAVNIVDPDIAVITTIDLDHTDILGVDREAIGREKAGIMRENIPVICGDLDPPNSIIDIANDLSAPAYFVNKQFDYKIKNASWDWSFDDFILTDLPVPRIPIQNAAVALMVVCLLQKLYKQMASVFCPLEQIAKQGLQNAQLLGRFQRFFDPVEVIVDVAHNPESSTYLAQQLKLNSCKGKTSAVLGMLKDKDIKNTIKPMLEQIDVWYVADLFGERAAKAVELNEILQQYNESCYTHASVIDAYEHAIADCSKNDRVVVFGSFYTVGDVLKYRGL